MDVSLFACVSCITFFLCVIQRIASSSDQLQLNPYSTLSPDLKSISHFPLKREIVVELKEQRRCQNPTFMTRLSGTSLYILDLEWHPYTKLFGYKTPNKFFRGRPGRFESLFTFHYPPLEDKGTYYIEVLALYCGSFDPNSFKDLCVESPHEKLNIVTLPYSFTVESAAPPANPPRARWVWSNATQAPALLPTRYQTRLCGGGKYCEAQASDLAQHRQYSWVDSPDWRAPLAAVLAKVGTSKAINVCFYGSSHEREMVDHGKKISGTGDIHFTHISSTHPEKFYIDDLQGYNCHYAIIGYGQWPVSYIHETPYTQEMFTRAMTGVFTQISPVNCTQNARIFVQSVNYNALNALNTCCTPIDHRTPPVVDMMNGVLRALCRKHDVGYIDLQHIIAPMWDSAEDWSHPRGAVFNAEVEYALHRIFSSSIQYNKFPVL